MLDKNILFGYYSFLKENVNDLTLNKFLALNEDTQLQMTDNTLDKIFDSMMQKYTKIDFGDIPLTKGDITKFKYYENMTKCIDSLNNIANDAANKDFTAPAVLKESLTNIIAYKNIFEKGFFRRNSYVIILYNIVVLALFQGTSTIIASILEYVRKGDTIELYINKYKKSNDIAFIKLLIQFNQAVHDGSLIKYINATFDTKLHEAALNESVPGLLIFSGAILAGSMIIPMLKQFIYLFYHTKNKIADAAKIQAEYLNTNIEMLKNKDANGNSKIIEKQEKIKNFFNKIAKIFAVNNDRAEHDTNTELTQEEKITSDDIII